MKKILMLMLIAILSLSLMACQSTETTEESVIDIDQESSEETSEEVIEEPSTMTVSVENEDGIMVDLEVPVNPQRIAVIDFLAFDTIVSLGLEDNVVGMVEQGIPAYLQEYTKDENLANLGGLKEYDMEELMSIQPDIIFISGRGQGNYAEFSKIAPTVMSSLDYEIGSLTSFKEIASRNASILGASDDLDSIIAGYDERIAALQVKAEGKTALVGIITGGTFNTLGNDSRGSIIGNEIGFDNLAVDVDSTHGNTSSFELLVELDPEYVFIIDRDMAIGTEGASPAEQLMDNELVAKTQAYQNGNIIYLTPDVWYLAEGGIMAMDQMLTDIESAFE